MIVAIQPSAIACSASPTTSSGRPPMRSESAPAIGATIIGMPVHGSVRSPALERRVALHVLQVLGQQEDRAEHPEEHQQRRAVRGRERAVAEEPHRQHRRRARAAPRATNPTSSAAPAASDADDLGARPALLVGPHEAPHEPNSAGADEADARQVEPSDGPRLSRRRAQAERQHDQAERHVQPEDPLPGDALRRPRRRPAGRARRRGRRCRPRRRARARAARPGPRRVSRVRVSGVTIAPPTPCTARAAISRSIDGASAAAAEASVKIADADQEQAPAPEAVAERRARQEQHGEGQGVGVDRPLEPARWTRAGRAGSSAARWSRPGCRASS